MKLVVCLVALALVASAMAVDLSDDLDPRTAELLEMLSGSAPGSHQSSGSKGGSGKLPAAPSDKNKQKDSDGKKIEKPVPAKKSKANTIKNAASSAKKVTAKVSVPEHVTLVNSPTWAKVKRAQKGQKIEALVKEIGGNFVKKVEGFIKRVWDTLKKLNPFPLPQQLFVAVCLCQQDLPLGHEHRRLVQLWRKMVGQQRL
jgi:hypothetical protein